jgi:hypothetical protein
MRQRYTIHVATRARLHFQDHQLFFEKYSLEMVQNLKNKGMNDLSGSAAQRLGSAVRESEVDHYRNSVLA